MKRTLTGVAIMSFGLLLAAPPVLAHHAVAAEFDRTQPITFTGTVKKVEWMNPHIYTHIEAKDSTGKIVVYQVEGGAPNSLFRSGWRPDTLKIGETVKVTAIRAKRADSMRLGNATITKLDGTQVFSAGADTATSQP